MRGTAKAGPVGASPVGPLRPQTYEDGLTGIWFAGDAAPARCYVLSPSNSEYFGRWRTDFARLLDR
jgi:hypothetical protein